MLKSLRSFIRSHLILTPDDRKRLLENGRRRTQLLAKENSEIFADFSPVVKVFTPDPTLLGKENSKTVADFIPIVKVFTPDTTCVWLFTELDPNEPDLAFGLHDLGMGCPVLGYVRLSELEAVRGPRGLRVKRDPHFKPKHPISKYAEDACKHGRIRH